jgi:hypothetical protein
MYRQTTEEANTNQYTNKRLFHGKFLSRNQKRKIMENPNTTKSKIPTVDELIRSPKFDKRGKRAAFFLQ